MSGAVLDASALVALLMNEQGAEDVLAALDGAAMSAVNLSEVVALFTRRASDAADVAAMIDPLPIDVFAFDRELAWDAGRIAMATRDAGLSLGDRCCLALARRLGLPAMTADKAWTKVAADIGVQVRVIR